MKTAKKESAADSKKPKEIVIKETEDDVVFNRDFSASELKEEIKKEAERGDFFSKYFLPIFVFVLIAGLSAAATWYYAKPERTEGVKLEDKVVTPPKVESEQTTTPAPAPTTPTPTPAPAATPETYTVKEGDSLSSIANGFGLTSKQVADYNGITDPNSLQIGQVIKIPK